MTSLVMFSFQVHIYVGLQALRASRLYAGDTPESCKEVVKGIVLVSDEYNVYRLRRLTHELVVL